MINPLKFMRLFESNTMGTLAVVLGLQVGIENSSAKQQGPVCTMGQNFSSQY
jgi:hypothetical protein